MGSRYSCATRVLHSGPSALRVCCIRGTRGPALSCATRVLQALLAWFKRGPFGARIVKNLDLLIWSLASQLPRSAMLRPLFVRSERGNV